MVSIAAGDGRRLAGASGLGVATAVLTFHG
jgi:hypothetical protein